MADLGLDASPLPVEIVDDTSHNELGINADRSVSSRVLDGSGNAIGSDTGNPSIQYLRTSVVQSIVASINNSSTANITHGSTFTGTADIALGQSVIEINFFADKNCTINVDQSSDSVNWDINDNYTVSASTGDARTFQSLALYWRIRVTNTAATDTTVVRLQSALVPIANPLPRALSQKGNLQTAIVEALPTGANSIGTVKSPTASNFNAQVESVSASTLIADNQILNSIFASSTAATLSLAIALSNYGGAFSGTANGAVQGWSKSRTSTIFKTVSATASGNTAIWTPGTGNKFRLLGFRVQVTGNATANAVITIKFQDATTDIGLSTDVFVPLLAGGTMQGYDSGLINLGTFGILSAAANNVLNVNLSAALTAGNARIIVIGTEE